MTLGEGLAYELSRRFLLHRLLCAANAALLSFRGRESAAFDGATYRYVVMCRGGFRVRSRQNRAKVVVSAGVGQK